MPTHSKVPSGTPGLDSVLDGGFVRGTTTVVTGGAGSGKTILALQFLAAGSDGLYIGFEERESDVRRNAAALGIDMEDVEVLDLSASGDRFFGDDAYTVFPSEQVEGEELLERITDALDDTDVDRLVIDPLTELRALLPDDFQFRRNISSLFNELNERSVTTLCTAQPVGGGGDTDLQFLGNTSIVLRRETDRRTLEVTKYRGSSFATGHHTLRIHADTGAQVYPKLVPGDHYRERDRSQLASGIENLDRLLGGGIERGSVTVVSGPSGVGKTTTASVFLEAAAKSGARGAIYLFEELKSDYLYRSGELGLELEGLAADGEIEITEVESLTRSPDEFAHDVRQAVEERGVEFVVLDGVSGYRLGLRGDDSEAELTRELHALSRYLKRMGVTVVLIEEVGTVTGDFTATTNEISYLADNLVFLRYLELEGELRKAIGVLKKRYSRFESALRRLEIDEGGVQVGDKLVGYQGLLTGVAEPSDGPGID